MYPAKLELAERLLAMAGPGFTKVFFTLGGAEANENAIKIARLVQRAAEEPRAAVELPRRVDGRACHSPATGGGPRSSPGSRAWSRARTATAIAARSASASRVARASARLHIGDLLQLEGPRAVAAVFLEPVPGANGVLVPPAEYWPIVRKACDDDGALLVADEVLTGFGRTGKPFGFQHWDVVPDLITVAKGLASGYATIGAVIVHDRDREALRRTTCSRAASRTTRIRPRAPPRSRP